MNHLNNRNVLVMGLGLFGGGVGAVRFLCESGANVTVTDLRSEEELQESILALEGCSVSYVLGRHDASDFADADLVVANPGVPRTSKFLGIAESEGIPVTTEICLFVERCQAPIIGITGSSGKTTTTALLVAMLEKGTRKVYSGGNIGGSLLSELESISTDSLVVLELSSFQLDRLGDLNWSPYLAVVTNFTPNHLDVHGSLEAYRTAKKQIVLNQNPDDITILNEDDPEVREWGKGNAFRFSTEGPVLRGTYASSGRIIHNLSGTTVELCETDSLNLPGKHNLQNALAATCAALSLGVPNACIRPVLEKFEGVEHRLEFVSEVGGVRFLNDSIATSPERTLVALRSVSGRIILIAGGYDKGLAFDQLGIDIGERVSHLVLIGATAGAIAAAVPCDKPTTIHCADSLEGAVEISEAVAREGDTVLFSPASASYDMFRNFVDRGVRFKELVSNIGPKDG